MSAGCVRPATGDVRAAKLPSRLLSYPHFSEGIPECAPERSRQPETPHGRPPPAFPRTKFRRRAAIARLLRGTLLWGSRDSPHPPEEQGYRAIVSRSEEHTSELQSLTNLV